MPPLGEVLTGPGQAVSGECGWALVVVLPAFGVCLQAGFTA